MAFLVFNVFTFMFELIDKMADLYGIMYDFLFNNITLGQWEVSVWGLIGGVGLISLLIAKMVKAVVPFL